MDQLDFLADRPLQEAPAPPAAPCVRGSRTSAAAASDLAVHVGRMELAVLKAIIDAGDRGLIDEEIPQRTGLRESTCRARRVELHAKGEIRDSGRTRPTSSGRQATIWIARSARPGPAEVSAPPREAARAPVGKEDRTAEGAESAEEERALTPVTRHASPATSNPRPCTWCGRSSWWRSVHGVIVCANCYPPAVPELVAEWIGESRSA